jgi:hypothetical protein
VLDLFHFPSKLILYIQKFKIKYSIFLNNSYPSLRYLEFKLT